jgi:hypothetical protein
MPMILGDKGGGADSEEFICKYLVGTNFITENLLRNPFDEFSVSVGGYLLYHCVAKLLQSPTFPMNTCDITAWTS